MTTYDFKSITPRTTQPAGGVLYGSDDAGTTTPAPYTQAGVLTFLGLTLSSNVGFNSLALGGATIGANALAVTGAANFSSTVTAGGQITSNGGSFVVNGAGSGFWVNTNSGFLAFGTALDGVLQRDTAGILAQVNGTNAQTFRVYNTSTSSNANYERLTFGWDGSNNGVVGTEMAGTGVSRNIKIIVGGTNVLDYGITNASVWTSLVPIKAGGVLVGKGTNQIESSTGLYIQYDNATSTVNWLNNKFIFSGATSLFQFGGTTSSFPALKRNLTALNVRLADDSADAPITALTIGLTALTFSTLPTGVAGTVAYITDCNANTWGTTAAGGGANKVLVWYNGTNWTVAGK